MHFNNPNETYINLGRFLHIFNDIESFLSIIITHHINPEDKEFFQFKILNPAITPYGAKLKILTNLEIFTRRQIEDLRNLSINRNVIAHSNRLAISEWNVKPDKDNTFTSDFYVEVNLKDTIFKTNSNGKLDELKYPDFIKEHITLQDKVIDLVANYIISKDINTKPHYHISNLHLIKSDAPEEKK